MQADGDSGEPVIVDPNDREIVPPVGAAVMTGMTLDERVELLEITIDVASKNLMATVGEMISAEPTPENITAFIQESNESRDVYRARVNALEGRVQTLEAVIAKLHPSALVHPSGLPDAGNVVVPISAWDGPGDLGDIGDAGDVGAL